MIPDWGTLFGMALQTVPEPRKVARDLFNMGFSRRALWLALAFLLVAMTWLGVIASILFPPDPAQVGTLLADPIRSGLVEAAIAVLSVFGIWRIGRAFGGQGRLEDVLMTMVWLQFVLAVMEIGVLALMLFAPGLAVLLWIMGIVMSFWIMAHFTTEAHGFRSAGLVFAVMISVILGVAMVLSFILVLLGVAPPVAGAG